MPLKRKSPTRTYPHFLTSLLSAPLCDWCARMFVRRLIYLLSGQFRGLTNPRHYHHLHPSYPHHCRRLREAHATGVHSLRLHRFPRLPANLHHLRTWCWTLVERSHSSRFGGTNSRPSGMYCLRSHLVYPSRGRSVCWNRQKARSQEAKVVAMRGQELPAHLERLRPASCSCILRPSATSAFRTK